MKFDELDSRMRVYETAFDRFAGADAFLVARIDGRSFTRLTKEIMEFERPFDAGFRDHMIGTVSHLMNCGFHVSYGYTQSDEISLLFRAAENSFGRSVRKWTSILAGEASAAFSVRIGKPAAFDCRVIELPSEEVVVDYFRWRAEDAHRNALNAWCYWTLRDDGLSVAKATSRIEGLSVEDKRKLLATHGIEFDTLPHWQRRGTGVVWEEYEKEAVNPKTNESVMATRRRLKSILELPVGDAYTRFIRALLQGGSSAE